MTKYDWSRIRLQNTVKNANCWFDWLRKLEIPTSGCNYRTLKNKSKEYNIDTSHFNYVYAKTHNGGRSIKNLTDDEVFYGKHKLSTIKNAYIDRFLKEEKCELCGISEWMNKPIVLQLHHIDGNNKNNNPNNLQLLCPNCHSQTDNFSNKKRK